MPESSSSAGKAVFLSYAREDTDAARRIADALKSRGIEVWFDQNELRGGDAWDQMIRKRVRECALFMAVISGKTQQRREGYFRREWKLATDRTHDMVHGSPFLLPVVVDETRDAEALVPDEFLAVQWTRLPSGLPTPEFVERVARLLRDEPPAARTDRSRPSAVAPSSPKRTWLIVGSVAVAALVGAGLFVKIALPRFAPASPAPAPVAPVAVGPTINPKSIAVLPFENMSEEKDTGFFSDGMQEDILTHLALMRGLHVVSRTTVMRYRDTTETIPQIGKELSVAYVLEGSVRRAGNTVRVTGQLIDARTDTHVWAQAYDRPLNDVFAIQSELSQAIAQALSEEISPEVQAKLSRKPTEDTEAYDLYLKARQLNNDGYSGSQEICDQASALLEQTVKRDPHFAEAWGELADTYARYVFWNLDTTPARIAQGEHAIAEAQRLAPDSVDVIRDVGTYAYYAHRDYAKAIEEYSMVAALTPNDPTNWNSLALIQRRQGHWVESMANSQKALDLDPSNQAYIKTAYQTMDVLHHYPEAYDYLRRTAALNQDALPYLLDLWDYSELVTGNTQARDQWLASLSATERETPLVIFYRSIWAFERGDYAEAKRLDLLHPYVTAESLPSRMTQAVLSAGRYMIAGDLAAARARITPVLPLIEARLKAEPGNLRLSFTAGISQIVLGHKDEGIRLIEASANTMTDAVDAVDAAAGREVEVRCLLLAGEKDQAIAKITDYIHRPGAISVQSIKADGIYAPIRSDPRIQALLNDPKNSEPLY